MSESTSYDFQAAGLSPSYIKTCLEELAGDQLDLEHKLVRVDRQGMFIMGGLVISFGVSILTVKMMKNLINGLNGVAQSLYVTQQRIGFTPPGPAGPPGEGTVPDEDVPPASKSPEQSTTNSGEREQSPVNDNNIVDIGKGYDPGPQSGPDGPLPPVFNPHGDADDSVH